MNTQDLSIGLLFVNAAPRALAVAALEAAGLRAGVHRSMALLLDALARDPVDAVLLEDDDEQLAGWLAMLRLRHGNELPLLVAGTGGGRAMLKAMELGACDFVALDKHADTLAARVAVHVALRRAAASQTRIEVSGYLLDASTRTISHDGLQLALTEREFSLAWLLARSEGRSAGLDAIAAQGWGRASDICKRTIEQHAYRLRRKLARHGFGGFRIEAVHGIGYRLRVESPEMATAS